MKTHSLRYLHMLSANVGLALAWLLVPAVSFSSPAHAQETWRLDPQLSIARLSSETPSSAARPHLVARRSYGRSGTVTRRSRLAKSKS